MDIIYRDDQIKIIKGTVKNCLEIYVKKDFQDTDMFHQAIQRIKYYFIKNRATKLLYVMEKVENLPDIEIFEKDLYYLLVRCGVKKVAIVTGKNLGTHAYHYKIRKSLLPMASNLGLDSELFFNIENARIWITGG